MQRAHQAQYRGVCAEWTTGALTALSENGANKSWSYLSSTYKMNDFNGGPVVPPHVVGSPSCSCTSSWNAFAPNTTRCVLRTASVRFTRCISGYRPFAVLLTWKQLVSSKKDGKRSERINLCWARTSWKLCWFVRSEYFMKSIKHCDMTVNPQNNVGVCDLYSRESCESVIGCIRQASLCNSLLLDTFGSENLALWKSSGQNRSSSWAVWGDESNLPLTAQAEFPDPAGADKRLAAYWCQKNVVSTATFFQSIIIQWKC